MVAALVEALHRKGSGPEDRWVRRRRAPCAPRHSSRGHHGTGCESDRKKQRASRAGHPRLRGSRAGGAVVRGARVRERGNGSRREGRRWPCPVWLGVEGVEVHRSAVVTAFVCVCVQAVLLDSRDLRGAVPLPDLSLAVAPAAGLPFPLSSLRPSLLLLAVSARRLRLNSTRSVHCRSLQPLNSPSLPGPSLKVRRR